MRLKQFIFQQMSWVLLVVTLTTVLILIETIANGIYFDELLGLRKKISLVRPA
jgi:hypothetical protein